MLRIGLDTTRRTPNSLRGALTALLVMALGLVGVVFPIYAHAAPTLTLSVSVDSDGTPDADANGNEVWDGNDDAGNDSGPKNGIVRVNDTVTYKVEFPVSVEDAKDVTFTLVFPKGMEVSLPPLCTGSGSSVTPETAGTPATPLTEESIDQLKEQTLVCNLGDIDAGSTGSFNFPVKVLNLVPNGKELTITSGEIKADGVAAVPASSLPAKVKASSRLKWDISKNGVVAADDEGAISGPFPKPCSWDAAVQCFETQYTLLLGAPADGKGAMPAIGDITLVDDVSPRALFPGLSEAQYETLEGDLDKYGARLKINPSVYGMSGKPARIITPPTYTATNSVIDSGAADVSQPGPGQAATITISDADTTLRTYPSMTHDGQPIPADTAYAISHGVIMEVPTVAIEAAGTPATSFPRRLLSRNSYTDLKISGLKNINADGTPGAQAEQTSANQPTGNDYKTRALTVQVPGVFNKAFAGTPGQAGNMRTGEYGAAYEGPPGGAVYRSGNITVAPTQNVQSMMWLGGANNTKLAPVSYLACDYWDNTQLNLQAKDIPASTLGAYWQWVPSEGAPVWVSGYNNVNTNTDTTAMARTKEQTPPITVRYAASGGDATECGGAGVKWYDTPTHPDLKNDPVLAAQGIYTGVARVQVAVVVPPPVKPNFPNTYVDSTVVVSVSLRVADNGLPTGTVMPNRMDTKRVLEESLTLDELLNGKEPSEPGGPRGPVPAWTNSTYDPKTRDETPGGDRGDRVILADAQARLSKQVRRGNSGNFSSTPPGTIGDDLVQYRLAPSLTSGAATTGILKDVWIEDCLPSSQVYSSATLVPALVVQNVTAATMPADAKRPACAAGSTYLRWVIIDHEVNQPIEPIILSVTVDQTAADGPYQNTAVVWAEDDASTLAQRTAQASIQVTNVRGVKITKRALTPVVQVNRSGQSTNELNEWSVRLLNRLPDNAEALTDPDVIDVLPKQGADGTTFNGTFVFVSAEATEGSTQAQPVKILYTKAAAPNKSPKDASNGAAGSTTWCDAPAGGAVVSGSGAATDCPASAAEVTAVRAQRAGNFELNAAIAFTIRMVGVNNRSGDLYVNSATAAAGGLNDPVSSARSTETVIESSIGDYVWLDYNRNGLQDADENPVAEVMVSLTGTDDLGNSVTASATTGADGKYSLPHLRSSSAAGYVLTFTKPDGTKFTQKMVNGPDGDQTNDSNVNPATGATDPVVIGLNEANPTIDAGLQPTATTGITVVKKINGNDANDAPGVMVEPGSMMNITFEVTNTGTSWLSDLKVTDDKVSGINCLVDKLAPAGDAAGRDTTTCTAQLAAPAAGATHTNIATATGTPTLEDGTPALDENGNELTPPTKTDPANAFTPAATGITVVKKINGDDANDAPGVKVEPGSTMNYTFEVTNTGTSWLTGVTLTDDKLTTEGAIDCPKTALAPAGTVGSSMTCTATGPAPAVGTTHTNTATATGDPSLDESGTTAALDENGDPLEPPTDTDPANAYVPPTPEPSPTPTPTPTPTKSASPTTPTPTPTKSASPTPTPTPTKSAEPTPTEPTSPTPLPTKSASPTPLPTAPPPIRPGLPPNGD